MICPKLSDTETPFHLTIAACRNAQHFRHGYCRACENNRASEHGTIKPESYIKLLTEIMKISFSAMEGNKFWVEDKVDSWFRAGGQLSVSELDACILAMEDYEDVREWVNSDARSVGSFIWMCEALDKWSKSNNYNIQIDPHEQRERLNAI